jgi:adenylate kinase family enzyme
MTTDLETSKVRPSTARIPVDELASCKRILILGPSGAGKTYLSLRLSKLLSRQLVHLDAHFWKQGWVSTPQSEWRKVVAALVHSESWIMDGTYESTLDLRLAAADAVILIDDWSILRFFRVLARRFGGDDKLRPDAPPGQRLDLDYLRYIFRFSKVSGPLITDQLSRHGRGKLLLTLSGRSDIDRMIRQTEAFVSRRERAD